jgi:8-oxo-dGTP diphosphatase
MNLAYGGVVFNDKGEILFREPRNHYGGYVWTFAKGQPDGSETPEATALREVREETGVVARILCPLGEGFQGTTGSLISSSCCWWKKKEILILKKPRQ